MSVNRLTSQQRKALHLYFKLVSDALNDAGLTVQKTLSHSMELEWTPERVKDFMWRPTQKALLKKSSTTELSMHMDIDMVYEHLNRFLGEKLHIENIPFPHIPDGEKGPDGKYKIGNYKI